MKPKNSNSEQEPQIDEDRLAAIFGVDPPKTADQFEKQKRNLAEITQRADCDRDSWGQIEPDDNAWA